MKNLLTCCFITMIAFSSAWSQTSDPSFTKAIKHMEEESVAVPPNGVLVLIDDDFRNDQGEALFNEHMANGTTNQKIILYHQKNFLQTEFYKKASNAGYKSYALKDQSIFAFAKRVSRSDGPYAVYLQNKNLQFLVKVD